MPETWNTISDSAVRHVWRNKETLEEITVPPTFYEENGTPMTGDGDDMEYVRTEVKHGC